MKLYTEEQVKQAIQMADKHHYLNELEDDSIIDTLTPIELPSDLNKFKKIIEDRPAEFSQYNAYTLLFVIDLIKNGKEVPEQIELIKMIRESKNK